MGLKLAVVFVVLFFNTSVYAADACSAHVKKIANPSKNSWLSNQNKDKCFCGKELSYFRFDKPEKMSLDVICGIRMHFYDRLNPDIDASFYFSGSSVIDGIVVVDSKSSASGQYLSFDTNMGSLKFADQEADYKKLKVPVKSFEELDNGSFCIVANAKIELTHLVSLGGDSDESGEWITNFSVINIGKYKPCQK